MRLLFKQRFFSWFDSYDIYDEDGSTVYTVKGQLSWGHCLHILDAYGNHIGPGQEKVFTFHRLPGLDGGGQLPGVGLLRLRRPAPGGSDLQGAPPLDGHLCPGHRRPRRCPLRPDAGPGHRRRKVLAKQLKAGDPKVGGADPSGGSPGRPLTCGLIAWKRTALGAERRSFFVKVDRESEARSCRRSVRRGRLAGESGSAAVLFASGAGGRAFLLRVGVQPGTALGLGLLAVRGEFALCPLIRIV